MPKIIYTAEATVTGGRTHGHGATSDGALDIQLRPPGEDGGTNPEQLFAVGYAACFEGALDVVARRERIDLGEVKIDSKVSLVNPEGTVFTVAVSLDVELPAIDDAEKAKEIVAAAHETCPYSNATRGNVDVALSANGSAVGA